jgi:hypothetical protein
LSSPTLESIVFSYLPVDIYSGKDELSAERLNCRRRPGLMNAKKIESPPKVDYRAVIAISYSGADVFDG